MNDGTRKDRSAGAIVLGLSPTGLYAARELATLGVRVIGVSRGWQCGAVSRALTHPDRYWRIESDHDLIERLVELEARESRDFVLIPSDDASIEFLVAHGASLGDGFLLQPSYTDSSVGSLLDKNKFRRVCSNARVPAPRSWSGPLARAETGAADLAFPLLLKPGMIHRVAGFMAGRKVLVARDQQDLLELLASLPPDPGEWILQEMIPGPESRIGLVAGFRTREGELTQIVTARKLRQYPPGFGSASLVTTEELPDLVDLTRRLLDSAAYSGIFASEFKYDEREGCYKVLEINARPSLWFNITRHTGARVVGAAYAELSGVELPPSERIHGQVLWSYALKDLYSRWFYAWRGKHHPLPAPIVPTPSPEHRRCWAVAEPGDWAPALAEFGTYALKGARRLRRVESSSSRPRKHP